MFGWAKLLLYIYVMYKIKRLFKRFYNLYRWFPIIWKDQDWDDYYIFEILKFKLKNQAEYIGYHDRHTTAKRDAEKMMLCVRLIDKIQDEWYAGEYFDYFKQDLNFIDSKSHPGQYELVSGEIKMDNLDAYFAKYHRTYKQVVEGKIKPPFKTNTRSGIAISIAHINEEKAHKLLFKILEQNIRGWWD